MDRHKLAGVVVGKDRHKLTPELLQRIKQYSDLQMSKAAIARNIGWNYRHLYYRWKDIEPRLEKMESIPLTGITPSPIQSTTEKESEGRWKREQLWTP